MTNDGLEQGVGFYVDDVYYGRSGQSQYDLVDISQVEVLRGPQGTLFGKNTTAGAINISTKKPSFDPSADIELSGGNIGFRQAKLSVTGRLFTDWLAVSNGKNLPTIRKNNILRPRKSYLPWLTEWTGTLGVCCPNLKRMGN